MFEKRDWVEILEVWMNIILIIPDISNFKIPGEFFFKQHGEYKTRVFHIRMYVAQLFVASEEKILVFINCGHYNAYNFNAVGQLWVIAVYFKHPVNYQMQSALYIVAVGFVG